jgi:hypothetical protein
MSNKNLLMPVDYILIICKTLSYALGISLLAPCAIVCAVTSYYRKNVIIAKNAKSIKQRNKMRQVLRTL